MATLPTTVKRYIVTQLACYEDPSRIIEKVRELYKLDVLPSQISYYNPRNLISSRGLSEELKNLFEEARRQFREHVEDIGISQQAFRLGRLDRMLRRIEGAKGLNVPLAQSLLEQAAKEVGGQFTNKALLEVDSETRSFVMEVPPVLDRDEWARTYAPPVKEDA